MIQEYLRHNETSIHVPVTHESLLQRLASIREQLKMNRRIDKSLHMDIGSVDSSSQSNNHSDTFNIFRSVDRAPVQWPPSHSSGRKCKYRERCSFKTRSRKLEHVPPEIMKQYKQKKYKDNPNTNALASSKQKKKKEKEKSKKPQKAVDGMDKTDLVRAMQYEHPTRTLDIGAVNGNLNRILTDKPQLRSKIKACLQEVVRHASKTKRT
ncbi:hypothetical protein BCR41DRAFT_145368 [Lobosporangium transversale]|uniref:Uncharacterized protein n=1 Tax=Lobosporangium transversale TaxID=64571 RepID=A0A1Y2GEB1_9FUNG|nr:hypothetical protein BCR41DRAFT_145368 [Lobosporangium transversale]ORZ08508.1 hypothetical protein BCR41DRAFT_145368 [Lobosporangium transversale]|eukprot:XP_021878436.1 hypothetical protein BCR41DRAFT_145368 [Lobosporangium transversale]